MGTEGAHREHSITVVTIFLFLSYVSQQGVRESDVLYPFGYKRHNDQRRKSFIEV